MLTKFNEMQHKPEINFTGNHERFPRRFENAAKELIEITTKI